MKHQLALCLLIAVSALPACGRLSTPSMMNTSRIAVAPETTLDQIPVASVNENYLYGIAEKYGRYGTGTVALSLGYDPKDKKFSAMKAFSALAEYKGKLRKMGVNSITAETVQTGGIDPTLMVAYDSVSAMAPAGCRNMPGFDDGLTTPEIGDYKFGCSIDAMIAQQVYRPGDLLGNAAADPGDGRRAANTVEYYRRVEQDEAEGEINRIQRSDINAD